ncbi:MAG: hypothetical protein AB7O52_11960 [Planctomycetota bacterium]
MANRTAFASKSTSKSNRVSWTGAWVVALVAVLATVGCSPNKRFVPGPGGMLEFEPDLPAPSSDEYLQDGLDIRMFSADIDDDEFKSALAARIKDQASRAGTEFKSVRGTGKKPVYSIKITQLDQQEGANFSAIGGITGAIGGAVVGYNVSGSHRGRNAWIGGGAGALLLAWMFGEEHYGWTFLVELSQRTSEEGQAVIQNKKGGVKVEQAGSEDVDTGRISTFSDLEAATKDVTFNVKSNTYRQARSFSVFVKGSRVLLNKQKAANAAKALMLDKLPDYLFSEPLF